MSLTARHVEILQASAINLTLAESLGIRSITTTEELHEFAPELDHLDNSGFGILFPWQEPDGDRVPQIRLDNPLGDMKYAWPRGQRQILALVKEGPTTASPTLLIEGMKQALAVASTLGDTSPYEIVAMAGCYGTAQADYSRLEDRQVTVIFDADLARKEGVWNAANLVRDQLESLGCQVLFAKVPGAGETGIDDVLGRVKTPRARMNHLMKILGNASSDLPPKPGAATLPTPHTDDDGDDLPSFFDMNNKFLPATAAAYFAGVSALFESRTGLLRRYADGVYVDATAKGDWDILIAGITGNAYAIGQGKKVYDNLVAMLWNRSEFPSEFLSEPWLNCSNVMVHLDTGEVIDHTPEIMSTVQFGTEYDPNAKCPTFDQWLTDMAGDQADSLLEHFAQILDPTQAPKKHIVLYGPAGTGKSTLLRIIESVISGTYGGASRYVSAVDMEALNEGGFNTIELAGKLINAAGELSSKAIADITRFKTLTGDDQITADKKHHGQVTFRSRALFVFNANSLPQIKDSEPYFRRVAPFRFTNQAAMRDPQQWIEDKIRRTELSGVLNRLIEAWRRTRERGGLIKSNEEIVADFKAQTDPVLAWYLSEENMFAPEEWHLSGKVYAAYRDSCNESAIKPESAIAFAAALDKIEGVIRKVRKVNGKPARCVYFPYRKMFDLDAEVEEEAMEPVESDPAPEPDGGETRAASVDEIITLDLETTGLDMWSKPDEFVRLAGWMRDGDEEVSVSTSAADIPLDGVLVGQNVVGFDLLALHNAGLFDLEKVITGEAKVLDTMLLARQLDPPMARSTNMPDTERPHSLEKLAEKYGFEIEKDTLKKLAKEFGGYDVIPQDDERYIGYLKDDVAVTRKVLDKLVPPPIQRKIIAPSETDKPMITYVHREHKIAAIAALCRNTGLRVDVELLTERLEAQRVRREELVAILHQHGMPSEGKAPHMTTAGKEAIFAAFTSMGVEPEHFLETATGNISYGKDSMQNIAELWEDNAEIVQLTEVVQELAGQRSMYQQVYDCMTPDGRVHPDIDFKQASGRWSITKPGLTTVGKRGRNANEREIFLPEPGHLFVSTDFAQVDARCVAALSGDEGYMAMFEGDRDLHTEVAISCFGDPGKRQQAKAIGHGVNYGRGAKGIAEREGIDFEIAQEFVTNFFEQFPGIKEWQNECRTLADEGRLLDNGWGRKLKADPERAYTQAPGLVGQSCARDIMCEALLRVDPEVRRCLRLCVHDEFIWSIPTEHMDEYIAEITRAMTFQWRGVQFLGEPGKPAANWYSAYL